LTFFLFVFFALLIEEWKIRKKGYNKWQKNRYKKKSFLKNLWGITK